MKRRVVEKKLTRWGEMKGGMERTDVRYVVEEFMAWGELDDNGKPVSSTAGSCYVRWVDKVCGYDYDLRYRFPIVGVVYKKNGEEIPYRWTSQGKVLVLPPDSQREDEYDLFIEEGTRYEDRWVVVSTQRHTHDYVRKIYCEEEEPNRVCEKLNEMNSEEYQVVKFKVRLKD